MRIGIDYRILGVGPQLITRGMGRYTQQQLREVLRVDQDDEYVLLCNRGDDLSLVDAEIRDAENVSVRYFDASLQRLERLGAEGTLRRTERFQAWVHSLDLDLYHATTPLALTEPQLIRFDACPMVATFYDVIPLLYPAAYLDEWGNRGDWMRTLRLIRGAARLLAISNAARDDAREHLGVAADRIDVAYPFPEPVFRTLSAAAAEKRAGALDRRIRVPEEFVLAVTYPHHSKNVGVLLEAYALLPASLRTELPLVICCHLDPQPRRALRAEVERLGIGDDTILTGLVSDDELCLLYNRATMVVHPSRYEGFGLPVAEAMRCGAPVITTTASSLPEIAGDAGVLVDPDDPAEFADAMARLAHDRAAREALRWKGLAQSARFTGAALAHATLRSYRAAIADAGAVSAVDAASPDGTSRLRVAMWTPVPPHPTGVAGYAVGLVDALAPACDVELFVDDDVLPDDDLLERVVIHHHTAFDRRAGQAPFDAVVYQVGCSMHHAYMAGAIAAHPGITVLHELAWSPVMYIDAKLRDGTAEFRRLLAEAEGDAAVRRLDEAEAAGGEPSRCLFDYPMLGRLVRPGLAQIVHTAAAARELASRFPEARPHVIPLGIVDPLATDPPIDRDAARRTIGAGDSTFVIGVFGALHPVKRPEECVHAVRELGERGVDSLLLVVGRPLPGDQYVEELETLAKELGVRERVRLVGHAGDRAFDEHLVAADVVVNLQVPTANHMSGVVIRALAAGTPVVITDDPRWSELPDGCCFRVPPVDAGGASLADVLEALARDADLLSTAGRHARRYHETTTAWHLAAARYLEVIREVAGAGATPAPSPDAPKALVRCG